MRAVTNSALKINSNIITVKTTINIIIILVSSLVATIVGLMLILLSMDVVCDNVFVVSLRIVNDEYLVLLPAVFDDKGLTIGVLVGTYWNVADTCDNFFEEKEDCIKDNTEDVLSDVVDKNTEVRVGEDNCILLILGGVLLSELVDITLSTWK